MAPCSCCKSLFGCCCAAVGYESSGDEIWDKDATNLSYVGQAAHEVLRKRHNWQHHALWNVTSGKFVELQQTPKTAFDQTELVYYGDLHDTWFPEKLAEIVSRTEVFCDVLSLSPPDGVFMEKFNEALKHLHDKNKPITVRMLFGSILGMPVNCDRVRNKLTAGIPKDTTKLRLWVGAWRKGVSWNHAKIIAVDGLYLQTGGHNMWDQHYLRHDPVHDLSIELIGRCAHDGHLFANDQWGYIERKQNTIWGNFVDKLPDDMWLVVKSRVTVSEFPKGVAGIFPPVYQKRLVERRPTPEDDIPIITMGRYGTLRVWARPSDDAIIAMMDSAKKVMHLALQDLGPVCIPGTKITVPGCVWPKAYLNALGRAIWSRHVDIQIVVSNPGSIPGGLKPTEASYGNGWSCVDVAAEIIKSIRRQFPDASDSDLRDRVRDNLRVSYLRQARGREWPDGMTLGLHSKHFIIDDICCYIGSQNLYICDLAEWGVVIDHAETTKEIMNQYWNPMWETSYNPEDCIVDEVMDALQIDRDGQDPDNLSDEVRNQLKAQGKSYKHLSIEGSSMLRPAERDYYGETDDETNDHN